MKHVAPLDSGGFGDHGIVSWDRYDYKKYKTRHQFASRGEATDAIKKAAGIYGAVLSGVARRDPRWGYSGFYDPKSKKDYGWDTFPFTPKSVIVMAVPMDYHSLSASPAGPLPARSARATRR